MSNRRSLARIGLAALAVTAVGLAAGSAVAKGKKDKVDLKPTITYAKSWEAAIEEAKFLNVPIVVHSHGFY